MKSVYKLLGIKEYAQETDSDWKLQNSTNRNKEIKAYKWWMMTILIATVSVQLYYWDGPGEQSARATVLDGIKTIFQPFIV